MQTKFGTAKPNPEGYYTITSRKEGYHHNYLHKLVWEDHYSKKVPEGYVIHHLNHNKQDNRIQNLQCVYGPLHLRHHNDKGLPDEEIRELHDIGWTYSELAYEFNCHKSTICRILKEGETI